MHAETVDYDTGEYTHELRKIVDLSNSELIEHIEFLKQLGSEEYNAYIDDPQTLWLCFASAAANVKITR